tara:strand:- start:361 stop:768 length:408 start_codon:yes stop_codon:yes gene_type:complete
MDEKQQYQEFEVRQGDEMMSLDLAEVSQCVLPGNNRNEVELQFPESDAVEANNDQLVSVRFYIPPDPESDPSDRSIKSSAELLQQRIMKMANIRKTTGDVIGNYFVVINTIIYTYHYIFIISILRIELVFSNLTY